MISAILGIGSRLINSRVGRIVAAVVGAIIFILTFGAIQRRKGAKEERRKAKEADHEHAEDIRDRVSRVDNDPDRLREYEDRGFRD